MNNINEIGGVLTPDEKVSWDGKPEYIPFMINYFLSGLIFASAVVLYLSSYLAISLHVAIFTNLLFSILAGLLIFL
ncbi:MAG: hypothetical protein M1334_01080 [Patescibacteria group bacterium]|nr:hypothetical protein [Patescibacteria group bacterium]